MNDAFKAYVFLPEPIVPECLGTAILETDVFATEDLLYDYVNELLAAGVICGFRLLSSPYNGTEEEGRSNWYFANDSRSVYPPKEHSDKLTRTDLVYANMTKPDSVFNTVGTVSRYRASVLMATPLVRDGLSLQVTLFSVSSKCPEGVVRLATAIVQSGQALSFTLRRSVNGSPYAVFKPDSAYLSEDAPAKSSQQDHGSLMLGAFEKWFRERGVWPRLTHQEVFEAGWNLSCKAGFGIDMGPTPDKSATGWWCFHCGVAVLPQDVTHHETHDERSGGCGQRVASQS